MEAKQGVWYCLLSVLATNSFLCIITQQKSPTKSTAVNVTTSCCDCNTHTSATPPQLNKELNYSSIAGAFPTLDPQYRTNTLTRLGTDLMFDLSTCPTNSVMLNFNSSTFTPLHLDCPTLFIVGARKAGSSSLYHYVSKHPDFEGTKLDRGPKVGETFYFSSKYSEPWEDFLKSFPSDGVMTGESSIGNLVSCEAPQRIMESCGKQAKIVMLFRNPVDRFVSNFLMRVRLGSTRMSNNTAIATVLKLQLDRFFNAILKKEVDITKLPKQWPLLRCCFEPATSMIFEGLYYQHLMNWLCNFPRENILIINSEEFYSKPSVILDQVLQFLNLKRLDEDTYQWITSNVYNKGHYSTLEFQTLSALDRKKLAKVYKEANKELFAMLDWKNVEWQ